MTPAAAAAPTSERQPNASTRAAYLAAWQLFADWCQAVGASSLPAEPGTVAEFLRDCPAADATTRRRVLVIDAQHLAAGFAPPGQSTDVLLASGRPAPAPSGATPITPALEVALRFLPSHGWTQGMFGRRDRCLLFLSQQAGISYQQLARLTVADVLTGHPALAMNDDPVLCGPCALTRWLRLLEYAETRFNTSIIGRALADTAPLAADSPHLCRSARPVRATIHTTPLLPAIDQWGVFDLPPQRLTPHSLSRIVRDALIGDFGVHRRIDIEPEPGHADPTVPTAALAAPRYTRDDWSAGLARRRRDMAGLARVADNLEDVDRRLDELNRHTAAILDELNPESGGREGTDNSLSGESSSRLDGTQIVRQA